MKERFEYSPLHSELKNEVTLQKKQYQGLNKCINLIKTTLKKYNKSNLIYNDKHSFCKYHDIKKI